MAHLLAPCPAATATSVPIPARTGKKSALLAPRAGCECHWNFVETKCSNQKANFHDRRAFMSALIAAGVVSLFTLGNASAAQRRPPPPPPEERRDPNVSGLQAKILASKKRKEAMEEAMAKQRERGKPIN